MHPVRLRLLDKYVFMYFNCKVVEANKHALLVENQKGQKANVPLSQIHVDSDLKALGDEGTLVISEWFAERIKWE